MIVHRYCIYGNHVFGLGTTRGYGYGLAVPPPCAAPTSSLWMSAVASNLREYPRCKQDDSVPTSRGGSLLQPSVRRSGGFSGPQCSGPRGRQCAGCGNECWPAFFRCRLRRADLISCEPAILVLSSYMDTVQYLPYILYHLTHLLYMTWESDVGGAEVRRWAAEPLGSPGPLDP